MERFAVGNQANASERTEGKLYSRLGGSPDELA
jgi:hypothetical protein